MIENIEDEGIVAAIEESWWEILQYLASTPWGKTHETRHIKMVFSNLPLDGVAITNLTKENVDQSIIEATQWFSNLTNRFHWLISSISTPKELSKYLENHGFQKGESTRAMAINLKELDQTPSIIGLEINEVDNPDTIPVWSKTFIIGHGLEAIQEEASKVFNTVGLGGSAIKYLGLYRSEPVSTSQIFLGREVARLNFVATLPSARRKGMGTAISLAALNKAKEHGYKVAVLYGTEMGYPIYKRLGFKDICTIEIYRKEITST